jgi:hypothetical protein
MRHRWANPTNDWRYVESDVDNKWSVFVAKSEYVDDLFKDKKVKTYPVPAHLAPSFDENRPALFDPETMKEVRI